MCGIAGYSLSSSSRVDRTLAAQALLIMEQRKITSLVVAGDGLRVEGVLHVHDLWRTGLF